MTYAVVRDLAGGGYRVVDTETWQETGPMKQAAATALLGDPDALQAALSPLPAAATAELELLAAAGAGALGATTLELGQEGVLNPAVAAMIQREGAQGSGRVFSLPQTFLGDVYFTSGRPWVDASAFGADPTGATDSTAAIQAAIAAAGSISPVFIGPGTYLVSGLTASNSGGTIAGAGPFMTTLTTTTPNAKVIDAPANRLTIRDIGINGGGVAGYGVYLDDSGGGSGGAYQCHLENIYVTGCTGNPGIGFANADRSYSLSATRLFAIGNNLGLYLIKRCQMARFTNCYFYGNSGLTINGAPITSVAVGDGANNYAPAIHFAGCDFESPASGLANSYLLGITGAHTVTAAQCYFSSGPASALGEVLVNQLGSYPSSQLAIKDGYGDSNSTAASLLVCNGPPGIGSPASVIIDGFFTYSTHTTYAITDYPHNSRIRMRQVQGYALSPANTPGSGATPDLWGSAQLFQSSITATTGR